MHNARSRHHRFAVGFRFNATTRTVALATRTVTLFEYGPNDRPQESPKRRGGYATNSLDELRAITDCGTCGSLSDGNSLVIGLTFRADCGVRVVAPADVLDADSGTPAYPLATGLTTGIMLADRIGPLRRAILNGPECAFGSRRNPFYGTVGDGDFKRIRGMELFSIGADDPKARDQNLTAITFGATAPFPFDADLRDGDHVVIDCDARIEFADVVFSDGGQSYAGATPEDHAVLVAAGYIAG